MLFVCATAQAAFTDLQFGRYQVADTQWNVNACMNSNTCQIYSKQPGVAYKIPWTAGQLSWAVGDYIKFEASGNASYPYTARQYSSNGTVKATLGMGKILNVGSDYFFFMGSDNNTGQLFSGTTGMSGTAGVTWTGILNPTVAQVNANTTNYSATPLASGQAAAPAAPALCCGGSATAFNASATNIAKVSAFVNRTTADSKVLIEQIGNSNSVIVNQEGTTNNYVKYYNTGSNNNLSVSQKALNNSQTNYVDVIVTGNSNTVNISQQTTNNETNSFGKGVFANIADNNNTLIVTQKNGGSHYADISLSGGTKNVDITQQGNGNHMAKVGLSGLPTDLSLTQSGNTQQSYSINFNCATNGGCAKITVIQGQ